MSRLTVFTIIIASFILVSCDQCKEVECLNAGICVDGTCECALGFSGELCEVEDICLSGSLECKNDGECDNGECDCTRWYSGDECEDKVITKYEGAYFGSYACDVNYFGTAEFIDVPEEDNLMIIRENVGRNYEATFANSSSFNIESQTISSQNGVQTVSGEGEITSVNVSFTVTYDYSNQGSSTTCLFNGTK